MKGYDEQPEGFVSHYTFFQDGVMKYLYNREDYINMGFVPAGGKVELYKFNGYDHDMKKLHSLDMQLGMVFTVKSCEVGSSSSTYRFEEVEGFFNTVSFRSVNWEDKISESNRIKITTMATVEYDPIEDEYYLVSPELKNAGFKEGDMIEWVDMKDGSFLLKKAVDNIKDTKYITDDSGSLGWK
jgi:hypothetical protein